MTSGQSGAAGSPISMRTFEEAVAAGPMTVILTGGTGQVGLMALPHLVRSGHRVIALSRRVPPGPALPSQAFPAFPALPASSAFPPSPTLPVSKASAVSPTSPTSQASEASATSATSPASPAAAGSVEWVHPQSLGAWLARQPSAGPLGLLSCGPIALAADLLRQRPDIRHAVCISTSSVYSKIDSPAAGERALVESIVAAERLVREHCVRHGVALVILRPTLIYGCGLDRNVSRLAGWIRRAPVMPLAGAASGLRQPLHAGDLADLAVRALRYQSSEPLESPVCGGETLSYREMVRRIFTALDRTPRTVAVPPRLLNLALRVASGVGIVGEVNGQFIARQNLDLVFDDSPVRERFGFAPRPFRMTPADLAVPADVRTWLPDGGPEGDPPSSVG